MRRMLRPFVLACAVGSLAGSFGAVSVQAQPADSVPAPTGGSVPAANPSDVGTIDAIIDALYDVISGPARQQRDWDRFRSLHVPEARLIPTFIPQDSTRAQARVWSIEEYIEAAGPQLERGGFFEQEIGRVTERFENIVHAFSTYESRRTADGEVFQRGINSIQLMWDSERWWIFNIFWRGVGADFEIPAKYLQTEMD